MTASYQAIIFDMDGVLVDSERFYYERRQDFLQKYHLKTDHLPINRWIGADMRSLWPQILAVNETEYSVEFLNEQYLLYKEAHPIDYAPLLDPDAKKLVQFLKRGGYKIGLASSSKPEVIDEVLQLGQLTNYFDVIVSGTRFAQSKPDPTIYLYTIEQLQVPKEACLVIEDSEKGIAAARAADLTVWALKDTCFQMDQSAAHEQIDQLSDICKKLSSE